MLMLALDTTTNVCSIALGGLDRLRAEMILNTKKTHSQVLMPSLQALLKDAGIDKKQLEGIAVAIGPGSFTGIRIGLATAQGLAQGLNIPLTGVITLDALAEGCGFFPVVICPLLDARRGEVYTCFYRGGPEGPVSLAAPAAIAIDEVAARADSYSEPVIFTGDSPDIFRGKLQEVLGERYLEAPFASRLNRAALVLQKALRGQGAKAGNRPPVSPFYLRLPEAERRLSERGG